ncbi:MAG: UPF0182 family protein [Actinomycetota bacterium]
MTARAAQGAGGRRVRLLVLGLVVLFLLSISTLVRRYTDLLWYREVGFSSVFWTILGTQVLLAVGLGFVFLIFCLLNLMIVARVMPVYRLAVETDDPLQRYRAAFLPYLRWIALGGSGVLALLFGLGSTPLWDRFVLAVNQVAFGTVDPVFGKDIGFFVFRLPLYRFLSGWLLSMLVVVTLLVAAAHYLSGGIRPQAAGDRVTPLVKAHLSVLLGLLALTRAWRYRLDQFHLMFSDRGGITGATYTDVHAELPALKVLVVISVITAVLFLVNIRVRGWFLPIAGAAIWLGTSVLAAGVYPFIVQRFVVEPQKLQRETRFIERHISATRVAYGIEGMEVREYPPSGSLSPEIVQANMATISNIRLWDTDTLRRAYRQLQEIRSYYQFQDVDVDRYVIDGTPRQVLLSTREMDGLYLAENQNWQNLHFFYTHGYGAVVSAASEASPEGKPNFLAQDIPTQAKSAALEVGQAGIYYGEALSGVYSLAPSRQRELDFPRREGGNQFTRYRGKGGIPITGPIRRLSFAWRFRDVNLAITGLVRKDSKILLYREVRERLLKAAPFLQFDTDPYPALVDGKIVWIVDGYTTTEMYPYSDRIPFETRTGRATPFGSISAVEGEKNYIRNSVKATVDAYDGTVTLYEWDTSDPLIRAWRRAFPDLFRPAEDMPDSVRAHVRYPEDLFRIQSHLYERYHMTDPTEFFTNEDRWNIASDPTRTSQAVAGSQAGEVQPYYVLMRLPGSDRQEYVLILPMNPRGRPNMVSWITAKSGPDDYGRLIDFRFPKGSQIDSVGQIYARINSTPEISQARTLLGREGSKVVFGNLLVIPIERSILYVQPLFVEAEQNPIPELKKVILATSERVVMGDDLSQALDLLLRGRSVVPTEGQQPVAPVSSGNDVAETALDHLRAAEEAARRGDWAAYGREQEAARAALQRLVDASASPSPSPAASP